MGSNMPTSVTIPEPLLKAVDRRARTLKISRSRLVAKALERELAHGAEWSPGFFERLRETGPDTAQAADELTAMVVAARRSGRPRPL